MEENYFLVYLSYIHYIHIHLYIKATSLFDIFNYKIYNFHFIVFNKFIY